MSAIADPIRAGLWQDLLRSLEGDEWLILPTPAKPDPDELRSLEGDECHGGGRQRGGHGGVAIPPG